MLRVLAPIMAFSLAFTACKDDDNTTETGKAIVNTPQELQGTWKTACIPASILDLNHTQREYVFNAIGDFDKYERFYSDEACTNLVAEYKVIGTVEAKGKAAEAEDPEAEQMNLTVNDATFTVSSQNALDAFNTLNLCGRSDWKVGEEVSVINADCAGTTVKKGDVAFELYDVKDGQLYLGQTFVFLTANASDQRPGSLNTDVPLAKQ